MDAALGVAKFLAHPPAANLVLAGLSITVAENDFKGFIIGKPKSTSGHSIPEFETHVIGCDDHQEWGGICFDAPLLTLYQDADLWVVEHMAIWVAGSPCSSGGPGSFRECFRALPDAVEFILRFYFRDRELFERLANALM